MFEICRFHKDKIIVGWFVYKGYSDIGGFYSNHLYAIVVTEYDRKNLDVMSNEDSTLIFLMWDFCDPTHNTNRQSFLNR